MQELARVYSKALFEAAKDSGSLDTVRDQLGELTDALRNDKQLAFFFFSPYFSSTDKSEGLKKVLSGADKTFVSFLGVLLERHRLPVIFRIRDDYEQLWEKENNLLNVEVTSAIKLDRETLDGVGKSIEGQTGQTVRLSENVDESVVGGIVLRVGNRIYDASIKNQLERLRKQVARAA